MKLETVFTSVISGNFAVVACGEYAPIRNGKRYTITEYARDAHYEHTVTVGKWNDEKEVGLFLVNVDRIAAALFGREYRQECVVAGGAVTYCDGLTLPVALDCANAVFSTAQPDGDWTYVQCEDGGIYFTVPPLAFATNGERAAWYRGYLAQDTRAAYRDNRAG